MMSQTSKKSNKSAAPYKHGKGYAIRRRYRGHDIFLSGHPTMASANRAMTARVRAIDNHEKAAGAGAHHTTLAQAMQDYALARLPYMKGAVQEARRINTYLRLAGLSLLTISKVESTDKAANKTGRGAHFEVTLMAHTTERVIPQGLGAHRKALLNANAKTNKLRLILAGTVMSDISRNQVQALIDQMTKEHNSPSTVALERAMLRVVFNHAFTRWGWSELLDNPATRLKMPQIDNNRTRVLSLDEQTLLDAALKSCRNDLVAPTLTLLRETAMRATEPLENATWKDVDWTRKVLRLYDAKTGNRDVPLSPAAIEALQQIGPGKDDESIVNITYESLRAAWRRACERAGIENLHIHDLRHTAATRMALKTGNVFLVQALTGHKTIAMLERYVNVTADDVVKVMHTELEASPAPVSAAPAEEPQAKPKRIVARGHLRLVA